MDWKLILYGFLLHVVLFYSIFDIYFTSPIIHGVPHHSNPLPPPAKRLVLISSDGLRADKLFELHDNISQTPFLRSVMEGKGRWGVSHTRVPTESRPGHVAIIAGFYEDVSAVAKGWKENPVEFDSVFNQSSSTYSWGSPDILPMFAKGAAGEHVKTYTYPGESENFAAHDHTKLDSWVFENVETFLKEASTNITLHQHLLNSHGIIFFLHLLGMDVTGHVHKPYSKKYVENMKVVDQGVETMVQTVENFFSYDDRTAYIFTSDHGMTDWGSHGASDSTETQTPFLAWGAGIKKSRVGSIVDGPWCKHERNDVKQADICPLMSILLGLPLSLQSVGIVPVDILNSDMSFKAHAVFTNIQQLYEQYKAKMQQKQSSTLAFFFTPYNHHVYLELSLKKLVMMLQKEQYGSVILTSRQLMDKILEGFLYYHNYERTQLGICVCLSYIGWMVFVATLLLQHNSMIRSNLASASNENNFGTSASSENPCELLHVSSQQDNEDSIRQQQHPYPQKSNLLQQQNYSLRQQQYSCILTLSFVVVALLTILTLYVESRPPMHFVYFMCPFILWYLIFIRRSVVSELINMVFSRDNIIFIICILACLEILIFSFKYRELVSLLLLVMSSWAFASHKYLFAFSSLLSGIFPLLPTVGKTSNYNLVYCSGVFAVICFSVVIRRSFKCIRAISGIFRLQVVLVSCSVLLLWWFTNERETYSSSSSDIHIFSWLILGSSLVIPLFSPPSLLLRLLSISIALFCPYILLSIAHESFFYLALCVFMSTWVLLETDKKITELKEELFKKSERPERQLDKEDVRRACFCLFFLIFSFFGTGNIASINSFDPTATLPFISVFDPFVMGGLCIFKVLVLIFLVTCFFQAIQVGINIPPYPFFLLLLIVSDFMACHFFFMVKDSGSWSEIGISISHYVIIMAFIIFFFILFTFSTFFTHTYFNLQHRASKIFEFLKFCKNNHITYKRK